LDETLLVIAAVDVRFRPSLDVVDEHLVRALDAELKYRESKGYLIADADSPTSLEQFVERVAVSRSILKPCSPLIARHIRLMSGCTSGSHAWRR
jgi:hypothetical protein